MKVKVTQVEIVCIWVVAFESCVVIVLVVVWHAEQSDSEDVTLVSEGSGKHVSARSLQTASAATTAVVTGTSNSTDSISQTGDIISALPHTTEQSLTTVSSPCQDQHNADEMRKKPRLRTTRCSKCVNCLAPDCGKCYSCRSVLLIA